MFDQVGTPAFDFKMYVSVPAAVAWMAPVPLPYNTPFVVNVVAPVPPLGTVKAEARLEMVPPERLATMVPMVYPVPDVLTVVEGSACNPTKNLKMLLSEASRK